MEFEIIVFKNTFLDSNDELRLRIYRVYSNECCSIIQVKKNCCSVNDDDDDDDDCENNTKWTSSELDRLNIKMFWIFFFALPRVLDI